MKWICLLLLLSTTTAMAETVVVQEDSLARVEVTQGPTNKEVLRVRTNGRTLIYNPNDNSEVRRLESLLNSAVSGQCLRGRTRLGFECQDINRCTKVVVQTYYNVRVELTVDEKNVIQSFRDLAVGSNCILESK